ncbi:thioesterase family protein [Acidiferrimicrobium sp. IK]|uniref:acyl-CoA thioesterase n=1 Tax=Acidiferrimicrobium sp. IK TaxID=2871700 RepID=UPI0021CB54DB|nr:acyl-CoA thioesterase domain-containing protein [Acidiferrimicrobium sp. IK]MCU4182899.1 thioesterase family protein [Acidiferrimicrobium sp. IK]
MSTVHDPAGMLALEQTGEHTYLAANLESPSPVVFGGQILAQALTAASKSAPGKVVLSLHTVFERGASPNQPLELEVAPISDGRTMACRTVTVRQGARVCATITALLHAPEADLIRHGASPDRLEVPAATTASGAHDWWDVSIVDDVDLADPDAVGPAELSIWSRFRGVPDGEAANQAMLGYASDGFLIATAMRPHAGVGQAQAHVTVSTSVLTQTISFHEPFDACDWHLIVHESPYAGRGRSYGRAHVYSRHGSLVASFAQDNIVRALAQDQRPAPGERAKY